MSQPDPRSHPGSHLHPQEEEDDEEEAAAAAARSCAQASLPNRPGGEDTAGVQWRGIPPGRAARTGQSTTARPMRRPPAACCKAWPDCTAMTGACARRDIMHASASRRADQPQARTPRTPALPPQQLVFGQAKKVALPMRWHGRFPELLRDEVDRRRLRQRAHLLQEPAELDEALGVLIRLHGGHELICHVRGRSEAWRHRRGRSWRR